MNLFEQTVARHGQSLGRDRLVTLQINVGRKCNQACRHCHVDAAPWRTEMMDREVAERVAEWILRHKPEVVDITGGAPEMSEHFRFLVETAKTAGAHVIDRCNLTIFEEKGYEDLPEYLASHRVEVVASLPCYESSNVDKQRGHGVFEKSIRGLKRLNALGYGRGEGLSLSLVYNPLGAKLPGSQAELEADYKEALRRDHGIWFDRLFTITNQPIARFAEYLRKSGEYDSYMETLVNAFNPATVSWLMCRSTVNLGWRGEIYDCDFNQMLGLHPVSGTPVYLWQVTPEDIQRMRIVTAKHCFACTAGCGSSCTGSLTPEAGDAPRAGDCTGGSCSCKN